MKRLLALLLASVYLGFFALHGMVHAADAKADTCCACQTGGSRAEAPAAPAVATPLFRSFSLPQLAAAQKSSALPPAPDARAPPAS